MGTLIYGTHRFELTPSFEQTDFKDFIDKALAEGKPAVRTVDIVGGASLTLVLDPSIPTAFIS